MTGIVDVGGGLRAIYGTGILDYCIDHEILFDYGIGVSAGSANLATYYANQKGRNFTFYTEYAFRKEYMSLGNFLRSRNYVDLDYIYGTLSNAGGENPLDFQTMLKRGTELKAVATDAKTGETVYFSKSEMSQDDYGAFKASCCLPIACQPYQWKGGAYYDGGLTNPVPYKKALEDGCDRVVVILTRPKDYFRQNPNDRKLARLLRKKHPAAADALVSRADTYNRQLRECLELEKQGKVLILAPDSIEGMKTLTKDKDAIIHLYKKGYKDAEVIEKFLDQPKG